MWPRASKWLFGLAPVPLIAAAVATDALPTQCGVVGRPSVQALAVLGIATGGGLVWAGIIAAARRRSRSKTLLVVALLELGAWFAVVLFYAHQHGGSYPNCG